MILLIRSGLPHSDIYGSMLAYQLPVTSRRLLRPSSPLSAKASFVYPLYRDWEIEPEIIDIQAVVGLCLGASQEMPDRVPFA